MVTPRPSSSFAARKKLTGSAWWTATSSSPAMSTPTKRPDAGDGGHTRPAVEWDTDSCSGRAERYRCEVYGFSAACQPADQCLDAVHWFPPPSQAAEHNCSPSMIRTPAGNHPTGSSVRVPATCGGDAGGGARGAQIMTCRSAVLPDQARLFVPDFVPE
jgi:hypothetical protein